MSAKILLKEERLKPKRDYPIMQPRRSQLFWKKSYLILFLFQSIIIHSTWSESKGKVFENIGNEVQQIYERNKFGLVRVRAQSSIGVLSGTGFFIDDTGTVLTTSSLVGSSNNVWLEIKGEKIPARILGVDRRSSVALLTTEARGLALKLSEKSPTTPGQPAVVLGFPYNQPAAPAFGFISGFDNQSPDERFFCTTHIRADINLTPGLIGGPLFNTKNEVIGLVTGSLDKGRNCYALPVEALHKVIQEIRTYGKVRQAWVGIEISQTQPFDVEGRNVVVQNIFTNSPAAQEGIQIGDQVIQIGSQEIFKPEDVVKAAFMATVNSNLPIIVKRDGEKIRFNVLVQERREEVLVGTIAKENSLAPEAIPVKSEPK